MTRSWCRLWCLVVAVAFGWVAGPARAATDEATIVKLIVDGRYDELKSLEAAAKGDDAVAQYWWGMLLGACVYDRCDPKDAQRQWVRSARAGDGRAREMLFASTPLGDEMDDLVKAIGEPATIEEKLLWALAVQGEWNTAGAQNQDKVIAIFKQAASSREPTMFALMMAATWDLSLDVDTMRAMIAAGVPTGPIVSEILRRKLRIMREKSGYAELLTQAKGGDQVIATVLCETTALIEGNQHFDADLLPLCIKAFEGGQLGLASALLAHYVDLRDMKQASRYADYCMKAPVRCQDALGDYLSVKLGPRSNALQEWTAILALQEGADRDTVKASREVYRKGLSRQVRMSEVSRRCMARRYLRDSRSFTAAAECPWGKPPQW